MIKIFRVDSRVVHGQTVNYWCDKYNISIVDRPSLEDIMLIYIKGVK